MRWAARADFLRRPRSGNLRLLPPNTNRSSISAPEDGVISRLRQNWWSSAIRLVRRRKQFLPRPALRVFDGQRGGGGKNCRGKIRNNAFLTPDGTCYQGRMVTGGRPDEVGPLGMKRELRALDAEMMQLEHAMSEKHAALEAVAAELRSTETGARGNRPEGSAKRKRDAILRHAPPRPKCRVKLARLGPGTRRLPETELNAHPQGRGKRAGSVPRAREEPACRRRAEPRRSRCRERAACGGARPSFAGPSNRNRMKLAAGPPPEFAAMNERLMAAEALAARLNEERARARAPRKNRAFSSK